MEKDKLLSKPLWEKSAVEASILRNYRMFILQVLTGSKGGSRGSTMEEVEEEGAVAATGISVHSLAGVTCGDMAEEKCTY